MAMVMGVTLPTILSNMTDIYIDVSRLDFTSQMDSYLSKSTAHGLVNIGNSDRWPGKLVWLLLTIVTMSCFAFHSYYLYIQLHEEKVLVSTSSNGESFIQPDIVFCPEPFFASDFINNPPPDEYDFMKNVSRNIQEFDEKYQKVKNKSVRHIWSTLNYHQLYKAFFQRKHQFFLSIKCNKNDVNIDELKPEMNLVYFACFRLKRESCKLNSPMDALVVKFYMHNYGLNLNYSVLNVRINNRTIDTYPFLVNDMDDNEMDHSIHVYFVQPNEFITNETPEIMASVKEHTTIKVRSTKYTRLSTKKSLCRGRRKYVEIYNLLEEDIERNSVNVTLASICKNIAVTIHLPRKRNCTLYEYPVITLIYQNYVFCGDIYKDKHFKIFDLEDWLDDLKMMIISYCRRYMPCQSIVHTTSINTNHWPRKTTLEDLFTTVIPKKINILKSQNKSCPGLSEANVNVQQNRNNIDSWQRNFAKVTISPGEYMSTVIEESAAYSYKNFFSDIGGIMGFYLGASLLTICELFRLMHCTVTRIAKATKDTGTVDARPMNELL